MSTDYKSESFRKLLDSLQQQSWELELIISGFAIFGLFTAYTPLENEVMQAKNSTQLYSFVIYLIAYIACSILLFNLLLHVILRGLWIGALGLRYVSGDIEFDELKYSDRFRNYLSKRIVSFDRYIARLENYCSVLFAISFLLIFYVIGLTVVVVCLALIANYILDSETLPAWVSKGVGIPLMLFFILGMFATFIDFVFQGVLKKNKIISKIYFPIYWVFSFITLSFLYRPLLYNFLDNKFGKRLLLFLMPVYFVILLLTSFTYRDSNYLNANQSSSSTFADYQNYLDQLTKDTDYIRRAAIPSKVITTPYLQVIMPFKKNIEDRIFDYNESLRPKEDNRGLKSDIVVSNDWQEKLTDGRNMDSLRRAYLKTFNETHFFIIDSLKLDADFVLTKDNKELLYFETYLNIRSLEEGKHLLKIKRKRRKKDTIQEVTNLVIPFWYYKDN